ncbi:hypothetical protein GURASL_17760 [Geotalea uraniireducens]|uniref:Uncharacterized protein n=1 Tax=Geotalea uraniireducens TaxID=351604 RepID=A0ABM8EJZ8_9BACT|nr:hypothetical protein [Geotalea uraniireducens]BDV42853.1 hypothetical protein GURASL_17760 [Geotalea uraniireducens]
MKRLLMAVSLSLAATTPVWASSDVGFDLNINLGNRPRAVAVPVAPAAVGPAVVIDEPPLFIVPPQLGFYVGVGVPYDIFMIGNLYYLHSGNAWYRSRDYRGPWGAVGYRGLPPGLRKHRLDRIRYYRDDEYRHYEHDRDHYRGRYYRPDKEWKERRKDERRMEREERKEHRGHGRDRD